MNLNGVASAPQLAQRTASWPMPSSRVSGYSVPQPGQTARAVRVAVEAALRERSLPDAVAIEVTSMSLMRIAIASPGSAPATATGWRDLVAAAERGRDHRPPAAGRRVDDDVAAVLDRPEHLDVRARAGRR